MEEKVKEIQALKQNAIHQGVGGAAQHPHMSKKKVDNAAVEASFLGNMLIFWAGSPERSLVRTADWPYTAALLGSLIGFETRTLFTVSYTSLSYKSVLMLVLGWCSICSLRHTEYREVGQQDGAQKSGRCRRPQACRGLLW